MSSSCLFLGTTRVTKRATFTALASLSSCCSVAPRHPVNHSHSPCTREAHFSLYFYKEKKYLLHVWTIFHSFDPVLSHGSRCCFYASPLLNHSPFICVHCVLSLSISISVLFRHSCYFARVNREQVSPEAGRGHKKEGGGEVKREGEE